MTDRKYWFPAKRYGFGWGIPNTWQDWAVIIGFVVLVSVGPMLFPPRTEMAAFLAYVVVLAAILTAVCWMTGEPARWRWGEDRRE